MLLKSTVDGTDAAIIKDSIPVKIGVFGKSEIIKKSVHDTEKPEDCSGVRFVLTN